MAQKHGSSTFPLPFVSSANCRNGAELVAESVQTLAGNARAMAEWIDGTVLTGVPPCAPITPHTGTPGHDHSGGTMGQPIRHTLGCPVFGIGANEKDAAVTGGTSPQQEVRSGANLQRKWLYSGWLRNMWIPGSPHAGAYTVGKWYCSVYASAACNLTMVWAKGSDHEYSSGAVALTAASAQEKSMVVPIRAPGFRQNLRLEVFIEYVAATAIVSLNAMRVDMVKTTP